MVIINPPAQKLVKKINRTTPKEALQPAKSRKKILSQMTITYLVRFYTKTKLTLMSHMAFLALYKGTL